MSNGNEYSRSLKKIKRAMALDPLYFAKRVAPGIFKWEFASFHRHMVNDIMKSDKRTTEIMVTRGHGKSMIATVLMPLWFILHGGLQYVVIISKTQDAAQEFFEHIKSIIESERFINYYGDLRGREKSDVWNSESITLRGPGLHARIDCRGAGQMIAGRNVSLTDSNGDLVGVRPQLVIIDDTEDDTTVLTAVAIDKLENWLSGTVMPGLHDEKSRVFLIGTTYKADCLLTRVENYKKGVRVIKYPLVVNSDKLSKKLGLPKGSPIWPTNPKFTPKEVQKLREEYEGNNNMAQYLLQYMLDARAGSINRFDRDDIDDSRYSLDEITETKLNWYMTVDMAYSRKKHADSSAIVLCAWDNRKHCYVVDARQGRWGDKETVNQMAMMFNEYEHMIHESLPVCVETMSFDAAERLVEDIFYKNKISFRLMELKPGNRPKENRIRPWVSFSQAHKLHLRSDHSMEELERQMWKFHGLAEEKDDDLLDALAYQKDVATPPLVIDEEAEAKRERRAEMLRIARAVDPDFEPEKRGINYRRQFVKAGIGDRIGHGARV